MTGPPIHISGLTIGRNLYGGKINPAKFINHLGKAKQLLERADQTIWGDVKHPNQTNKPNWVMEHTPIKIPHSPVNTTKIHVG